MDFFTRAILFVRRKKAKSSFLMILFLIVNCMVLCTLGIRKVSSELSEKLQKNSASKITLEVTDAKNPFSESDVQAIKNHPNVNWINRGLKIKATSVSCIPVFGNDDSETVFTLHGYDSLENDTPFADKIYRLTEGNFPKQNDEIVINQFLAEQNKIRVGDKILFLSSDNLECEAGVAGFFFSGMERNQTENVWTENRIENQIFGTADFAAGLSGENDFSVLSVYLNEPEKIFDTKEFFESFYKSRTVIGMNNNTFQKLKMMISQTGRIAFLIFLLTVSSGGVVTGLLLSMWMRARKTEIAVLISLGISKGNIFSQMMMEEIILYSASFLAAGIAVKFFAPIIKNNLVIMQGTEMQFEFSFTLMILVFCAGIFAIVVLTSIAIFPYMKKPVKEILSEMEF